MRGTEGVHGPARRWTVSPIRTASFRFPPSGCSVTAAHAGRVLLPQENEQAAVGKDDLPFRIQNREEIGNCVEDRAKQRNVRDVSALMLYLLARGAPLKRDPRGKLYRHFLSPYRELVCRTLRAGSRPSRYM